MSTKVIVIGLIFLSFIFLVISYFLLISGNKPVPKIISYSLEEKEKPVIEVPKIFNDMGKIKVSEEKTSQFVVKNKGSKPLQFYNITSSCGCTVGIITYQGKESREYGMHAQSDDVIEIAPNTEATVKVIYRPYVMPVYGAVEREVYMATNDPSYQKLSFKVKSFVQ